MAVQGQAVDLGILLGVAFQEFVRELQVALAAAGFDDLGRSDGFVFRSLAIGPMTVSELAGHLEITKQGAAQIIEDMERRGYVERQPDPGDGRAKIVVFTERGRRAREVGVGAVDAIEARWAATLGTELHELRAMLEVVTELPVPARPVSDLPS